MDYQFVNVKGEPIEVSEEIQEALSNIHIVPRNRNKGIYVKRICLLTIFAWLVYLIFNLCIMTYSQNNQLDIDDYAEVSINIQEPVITSAEIDSSTYCDDTVIEDSITHMRPEKLPESLFQVVISECEANNIPVNVVLAVMKTETQDFNTKAVNYNSNGTYDSGIMQINSSNIPGFAKRYNCPEFATNPHDAVANITVGVRYLAENYNVYLEHYEGDTLKTLLATAGAYNRGVGNQNKYKNIYEYNARVYAHWCNLENGIDANINYAEVIPNIKEELQRTVQL